MFWGGARIREELSANRKIVSGFDDRNIDGAAYTLKMGDEVFISPTEMHSASDIIKLDYGKSFNIPPGQFAFLLSEERVELPEGVLGLINMKSRIKLRGLVNVSGFHVDPGYKGKLVFSVFNAGPKSVTIRRGDDCFLLWFADLSAGKTGSDPKADFHAHARKGAGHEHIESALVSNIGSNVISLFSLNEKLDKMQNTADRWIIGLAVVTTILVSITISYAVRALGP